jgi:hypothetical protein
MLAAGEERRSIETGGFVILAFPDVGGEDMPAVDAEDPIIGHAAPAMG